MGALGGIMFLVGLAVAFIGHRHMGESPMESNRGPVYPIEVFIGGLVCAGLGLIIAIYSLANGIDGSSIHYSDFFPNTSE